MKKILVAGGAGYIGSHTAYYLRDKGYDVVIVDNFQTGHKWAVADGARLYEGDIRDKSFIDGVLSEEHPDAVIHFAACSLVGESMTDPLKYYDNNLYGTMVLLRSMADNNVKKIVFSSTAATYGEPERIPILESDRTFPTNPYGQTKLSMEQMMKWCDKAYGLKFVALRYFNACGAHDKYDIGEAHSPETHLIPIILQTALGQRESIKVFGTDYDTPDGTCLRDYIHVLDLADAHMRAAEFLFNGNGSDVFNLGNGSGFSVKEVIEHAKAVTGRDIRTEYADRRAGDPAVLVASSEKAKNVLGWDPQYADLDKIIESAWRWHKDGKQSGASLNG